MKYMIYPMIQRLVWPLCMVAMALCCVSCGDSANARTADSDTFTYGSLQGTYAGFFLGEGGRLAVGGVVVMVLDGNGGISDGRAFFTNPDLNSLGGRTLSETTFDTGSYSVDENGKGHLVLPKLSDDWVEDWNITAVISSYRDGDAPLAQEIYMMGDTVETLEGNLVVSTLKRLPDGATFNHGSFAGPYAQQTKTFGGQTPVAGLGLFAVDGTDGQALMTISTPGTRWVDREINEVPATGNLNLSSDGLAIWEPSDENRAAGFGNSIMVIMGARPLSNGNFFVTEFFMFYDLPGLGIVMAAPAKTRAG